MQIAQEARYLNIEKFVKINVLSVSKGEGSVTRGHVLSLMVGRVVRGHSGQGPGPGVISVARPAPTADC